MCPRGVPMTPQEMQRDIKHKSLVELAFQLQTQDQGTPLYRAAMAEFMRRQAEWQEKAADAQSRAAEATQATAEYTAKSARYILLSVMANVLIAIVTAIGVWLGR